MGTKMFLLLIADSSFEVELGPSLDLPEMNEQSSTKEEVHLVRGSEFQ